MLEKLNWYHLIVQITLVLLIWKWMGLFLRKNIFSNAKVSCKVDCIMSMRLTFSCKLNYIMSIAKTASKKIGALIRSMNCLSPEVALYLYKSTIRPFMKYFCLAWAGCYACCHVVMSGAPI